jgi:outer membrane protein TolC
LVGLLASLQQTAPATDGGPALVEVWSFQRCLDQVLEHGVGVTEASLRLEQAKLGLEDARKVFYPTTNVTSGVFAGDIDEDDSWTRFYLSVRIAPILDGYDKFFATQLSDFQLRLTQLDEEDARALLVSRLREAYLTLLALAEAEGHLAEAVTHQDRLVDIAGVEAEPDLAGLRRLEALSAAQRGRMSLRELKSRREEEELRLKTLLGLPPETPFTLDPDTHPSDVLPPERESAFDEDQPAASRAELEIAIAKKRLQMVRFEGYPQPLLRMGLNRGGLEIKSGAYVFAGVEVPLFDWGRRKRQRARLSLELTEREHHAKWQTLQRHAELARLELVRDTLAQRGRDLMESIDLAGRRLRAQARLYEASRLTAAELTRTQVELARERAEHALNQGSFWAVLCQREVLLELGSTSAR